MSGETRNQNRNTLIDGLRAVAVLCVLFHHWTDWGFQIGLGQIGVQTFFVISGFLITRILLASRSRTEPAKPILFEIRSFFIRRTLRIFPIYYLLLALIFLIDRFGIRETIVWHALYVSNVYFFKKGEFEGSLSQNSFICFGHG
jgi:peptidoglycan/LPS O-acetylase OafA/YrhL